MLFLKRENFKLNIGRFIKLLKIKIDLQGPPNPIYAENHIPFKIKRVFYPYDLKNGSYHGGHAHINLHQFLIALAGSFSKSLDNGNSKFNIKLNNPIEGLLIKPMVWRELNNFTKDSICLVLTSGDFDENDYIRVKKSFIKE